MGIFSNKGVKWEVSRNIYRGEKERKNLDVETEVSFTNSRKTSDIILGPRWRMNTHWNQNNELEWIEVKERYSYYFGVTSRSILAIS